VPKTKRACSSRNPSSSAPSRPGRGASALPGIPGAPARICHPRVAGRSSGLGAQRCRIKTRRLDTGRTRRPTP
jgi:hypothetical protein